MIRIGPGTCRNRSDLLFRAALCAFALVVPGNAASLSPEDLQFFESKVRPVLVERCYECHSAESEKIKGGLRVDSREALLAGGDSGPAMVPGKPGESRIIQAIRYEDEDLQMPPKEKLKAEEIAALEKWVALGAPDPRNSTAQTVVEETELWSTQPLRSPAPPKLDGWGKSGIDGFILARLKEQKLSPAPPADKRTLIRRATYDLTGLPPTPREVEAFLADESEEAFARVVDRLLDSPHFGERWGRHWLDLARYAESTGLDFNNLYNHAWRYRDYVVKAFNQDKPYDEFIREQIAGDLLPAKDQAERHEKWIATGFLMLGPKNFIEQNRDKLLMDVADEQIDVTSRAFLGLTVSCARCHDHKFDPIPTRDYYAMAGIFRSTYTITQARIPNQPGGEQPWSERPLGTPEETAAAEDYNRKLRKLQEELQLARRMRQELPGGIDSKLLDGIVLDNTDAEVIGDWARSNYSTNFVDKDYLHDGNERSGKGKKIVRFRPEIPREGFYEIRLAYTARYNRATNVPVRVQAKLQRTVHLNQTVPPRHDKAFEVLGVFELTPGTNSVIEVLTEGTKGFVVVDAIQLLPKDVELAAMLKKMPPPEGSDEARMMSMTPMAPLELEYAMADLRAEAPPPLPMAMAVDEGPVQNVRVNIRGDVERLGAEVPRGFLSAVEVEAPPPAKDSSGRLELAEWIADAENPLTPRVMVNRVWLHLFGEGIVPTPDNFGLAGQPPSHPELLDYLASEFVQEGWSVKTLIREIMLSSAYQMSSAESELAAKADPDNRLLSRMNRKRLEAEAIRDTMLALNGTLDRSVGGNDETETRPTGPLGGPNASATLDSRRRSIYLRLLRGNVPDFLQVLDFPDPHVLVAKRHVTTAPTQALLFMNSPYVLEQARLWTEHLLSQTEKSDAELVDVAYRSAFARPCSEQERQVALRFLAEYNATLAQVEPDGAARRAKTWEGFCQAIFQSTEFRFID